LAELSLIKTGMAI